MITGISFVGIVVNDIEEARSLNHDYIGTEHILLGLLRESEGIAAQVLANLGVNIEKARMEILKVLNRQE